MKVKQIKIFLLITLIALGLNCRQCLATFAIHLRTLTNETIALEVEGNDTIGQLKEKIALKCTRYPSYAQRLISRGKQLEDAKTVTEYKLSAGAVVHLVIMIGCSSSKKQIPIFIQEGTTTVDSGASQHELTVNSQTSVQEACETIKRENPGEDTRNSYLTIKKQDGFKLYDYRLLNPEDKILEIFDNLKPDEDECLCIVRLPTVRVDYSDPEMSVTAVFFEDATVGALKQEIYDKLAKELSYDMNYHSSEELFAAFKLQAINQDAPVATVSTLETDSQKVSEVGLLPVDKSGTVIKHGNRKVRSLFLEKIASPEKTEVKAESNSLERKLSTLSQALNNLKKRLTALQKGLTAITQKLADTGDKKPQIQKDQSSLIKKNLIDIKKDNNIVNDPAPVTFSDIIINCSAYAQNNELKALIHDTALQVLKENQAIINNNEEKNQGSLATFFEFLKEAQRSVIISKEELSKNKAKGLLNKTFNGFIDEVINE